MHYYLCSKEKKKRKEKKRKEEIIPRYCFFLFSFQKLKTMQISRTEMENDEYVEASITRHFAHLHGVLQNIESRMIDEVHERNKSYIENIEELETQLKSHQNQLQGALLVRTKIRRRNNFIVRFK